MEHPYTKLLNVLDKARYVRFFADLGLIYCWHGQGRVEVLNKEGACVDFFATPQDADVDTLESIILKHRTEDIV